MTYKLTPELLTGTNLPHLSGLAANGFVEAVTQQTTLSDFKKDLHRFLKLNNQPITDKNNFITVNEKNELLIPTDKKAEGTQYYLDSNQNLIAYVTDDLAKLKTIDPENLTDQELLTILGPLFPAKINEKNHIELINQFYSQALIGHASLPIAALINSNPAYHYRFTEINPNDRTALNTIVNIHFINGETYLEIDIPHYYLLDDKNNLLLKLKGSSWKFQLVENGFKFVEANIEEKVIYAAYLGIDMPLHTKNFPHYPLSSRIADSFHALFNADSIGRSDTQAFFGITDYSDTHKAIYDKIETYPLGMLFAIPKNILKLFIEFLPSVVEQTARFALDQIQLNINSSFLKVVAGIIPAALIALTWSMRQIASRLTSPVRALKEAYATGKKLHPVAGVILALISAALTVAAFTAVGVAGTTGLAALGVPYVAVAASFVAAKTSIVSGFIANGFAQAASLITISISANLAAIMASTLMAATAFAAVIAVRDRFKALLSWRARVVAENNTTDNTSEGSLESKTISKITPAENDKDKDKEASSTKIISSKLKSNSTASTISNENSQDNSPENSQTQISQTNLPSNFKKLKVAIETSQNQNSEGEENVYDPDASEVSTVSVIAETVLEKNYDNDNEIEKSEIERSQFESERDTVRANRLA